MREERGGEGGRGEVRKEEGSERRGRGVREGRGGGGREEVK